jgi:hypothetical protein
MNLDHLADHGHAPLRTIMALHSGDLSCPSFLPTWGATGYKSMRGSSPASPNGIVFLAHPGDLFIIKKLPLNPDYISIMIIRSDLVLAALPLR